jgi:hypothetical protein
VPAIRPHRASPNLPMAILGVLMLDTRFGFDFTSPGAT